MVRCRVGARLGSSACALGGVLMWVGAVVPPLLALGMVAYLVAGWRADNRAERLRVARHEELMTAIRRVR